MAGENHKTVGGEEKYGRAIHQREIITSIRACIVHSHQVLLNRQPRHQVVPISACQSNDMATGRNAGSGGPLAAYLLHGLALLCIFPSSRPLLSLQCYAREVRLATHIRVRMDAPARTAYTKACGQARQTSIEGRQLSLTACQLSLLRVDRRPRISFVNVA